jgi:hypothetical protein
VVTERTFDRLARQPGVALDEPAALRAGKVEVSHKF